MNTQLFIAVLTFALPMFSAALCCAILLPCGTDQSKTGRSLQKLLTVYLLTAAFGWFSMLIYPYFPKLFVYIQSFTYLSFLLVQLIFYHFVFNITKLDPQKRFPWGHYLLPVLICSTLFVWSFFVPFEVQLKIVASKALVIPEGYHAYYYLFTSKLIARFVFSLLYTSLSLVRLLHYRKAVKDFSANDEKSSLGWFNILIVLSFGFLLMPIIGVTAGRITVYTVILPAVFTAVIVAAQHVILTRNILKGKYLTLEHEPFIVECSEDGRDEPDSDESARIQQKLSASTLETFMEAHRPYLDPNLRIIDLAQKLGTNRTYLSALINDTYGMNFSRYINTLRFKELEKITNDPSCDKLPLNKRIVAAGFGSYRNYKRFKEMIQTEE